MQNTTKLFEELNSSFDSQANFELRFARKLNEDNQDLINDIKAENNPTEEQVRFYTLILSAEQFNDKITDLIKGIEAILYEKLDVLGDDNLKCKYIIEKNNKLKDIAVNIATLSKAYQSNKTNVKEFSNLFLPLFSFPDLQKKEGLIFEDILKPLQTTAMNIINMDQAKGLDILSKFSANDIYFATLFNSQYEINELGKRIILNHHNLFDEKYLVASKGFPVITVKLEGSISKGKETTNPYPHIFKNGYAYEMFLELRKLTVNKRTKLADYSYIFSKMKDKKLGAIYKTVTEPSFIELMNLKFEAEISERKFPFRNPDRKQNIYKEVEDKYREKILTA